MSEVRSLLTEQTQEVVDHLHSHMERITRSIVEPATMDALLRTLDENKDGVAAHGVCQAGDGRRADPAGGGGESLSQLTRRAPACRSGAHWLKGTMRSTMCGGAGLLGGRRAL